MILAFIWVKAEEELIHFWDRDALLLAVKKAQINLHFWENKTHLEESVKKRNVLF